MRREAIEVGDLSAHLDRHVEQMEEIKKGDGFANCAFAEN